MKKLLCFFGIPLLLTGAQIVINQPGETILGESISYNPPASNDSIIQIDSDDVILDLGGLIIEQGNSVSSIQGIEITSGRSNITIRNGTVSLVTGTGIVIPDNCFNVEIRDIKLIGCQTRAIEINGGGTTQDCSITNCSIFDCCTGSLGYVAIDLIDSVRLQVSECVINNSGNVANNFSALSLNSCQNCNFQGMSITANQGASIIGIDIQDSIQCTFNRCLVRDNTPVAGGDFYGFDFHGTSNQLHIITNSTISNNSSTTNCIGLYLEANSQNNLFQGCSILGNAGGLAYGFYLTGGTANNFSNTISDCMILSNSASGSGNYSVGVWVDGSNYGSIQDSTIAYNTSANYFGLGIVFIGSSGNNWNIIGNDIYRNIGSSNSVSYGVYASGGSTNLFMMNTGFNNGTGSATSNQFYGVPNSSVYARTSSNLNAICYLSNTGIPY